MLIRPDEARRHRAETPERGSAEATNKNQGGIIMAQKTIYVADKDLALYERAEELGGESLSSVIVKALRGYVAAKEAEAEGYRSTFLR